MSRRLVAPAVDAAPRQLAAPDSALDPYVVDRVDRAVERAVAQALDTADAQARAAVAEAYAAGQADALAAAKRATSAANTRATKAVRTALAGALAEVAAVRTGQARATVDLAEAIAAAVIGREPHDAGAGLLRRVERALAQLDEGGVVLHANAADVGVLTAGVADTAVGEVRVDPALGPGEARVTGLWAQVDLTRAAAWDAVRDAVRAELAGGADGDDDVVDPVPAELTLAGHDEHVESDVPA